MTLTRLLDYLPRGNLLDDSAWRQRHKLLLWVLGLHIPALFVFALWLRHGPLATLYGLVPLMACLLAGAWTPQRRVASFFTSAGLVYCSAALVVFSRGSIEAHFHFFIILGFIALYQDWVPFLWNIVFTVLSHGLGTLWQADLIFNHPDAQVNPWTWALIHGVAVLFACVGLVIFWRTTEDEQQKSMRLATQLADAELGQRTFTSELLVNLARRNQSMLYRQLDIINQLEEKERDPDALGELFRLDHLATRIRRNAESLLVLSGEEPPRRWREPVTLIDVVRAAIAETEDLDRVRFVVDERLAVLGHAVTDLTHVLAELAENAVRFSPPEAQVTIRTRSSLQAPGTAVITVEDWGVGMPPEDLAQANEVLSHPRDIDLSSTPRLGLHVVARLAARHGVDVSLTDTPGSGVTAVVTLPAEMFVDHQPELVVNAVALRGVATALPSRTPGSNLPLQVGIPLQRQAGAAPGAVVASKSVPTRGGCQPAGDWTGWWTPVTPVTGNIPSTSVSDGAPSDTQLSRRVPQANLAPELRRARSSDGVVAEPDPRRGGPPAGVATALDAQRAREALSRYQASREAARNQVDGDQRSGS